MLAIARSGYQHAVIDGSTWAIGGADVDIGPPMA